MADEEIVTTVPLPMTESDKLLWDATNAVIQMGLAGIDEEARTYTLMLLRLAYEIKKKHGLAIARETFEELLKVIDIIKWPDD
jgi:hypothetical protein